MAAIAEALASVPDDAARFRVLRWAVELYSAHADADSRQQDVAADLEPAHRLAVPRLRPTADSALVVGDLGTLFQEIPHDDPDMLNLEAAQPEAPPEPVESTIQNFVREFQKLARDWEDA
jgi:hypothetical protein